MDGLGEMGHTAQSGIAYLKNELTQKNERIEGISIAKGAICLRDQQQWCSSAYWAGFGFLSVRGLLSFGCRLSDASAFACTSGHPTPLFFYHFSFGLGTWPFDGVDIDLDGAMFLFHCVVFRLHTSDRPMMRDTKI